MRNGTILTLHIIPNHKLHTISFPMADNVAVCIVGTLNFLNNAFFEVWRLDYTGHLTLIYTAIFTESQTGV